MASYTNEYSNFPAQVIEKGKYKDVTNQIASIINQIKSYQDAGDYASAALLVSANPSIKDYMIGADTVNALIEEIRNAEIYAKKAKQSVFVQDSEPTAPMAEDIWIGE